MAGFLGYAWVAGYVGFAELGALTALSVLCLLPVFRWLYLGMPHIPVGEGFAVTLFAYYVVPFFSYGPELAQFSHALRFKALVGMCLFAGAFAFVYWRFTSAQRWSKQVTDLAQRELGLRVIWVMFILWVILTTLQVFGKLPSFFYGTARNIFATGLVSIGAISTVCIFYRCGKGTSGRFQLTMALIGLFFGVTTFIIPGVMIDGICTSGAALLAYALGRGRVPVVAGVILFLLVGFLHAGKSDYRAALQSDATGYIEVPHSYQAAYSLWIRLSWLAVTKPQEKDATSGGKTAILERVNLINILANAMNNIPQNAPYLYGKTYLMLPQLLIPRIFWAEKVIGALPSKFLAVYTGVESEEGIEHVSISIGAPTEAWANFGWLGLPLAGGIAGVLFGLPASLSRRLERQSIGWLICCVFLIFAVDVEHTLTEMIVHTLYAGLSSSVILLLISSDRSHGRRQNPRRQAGLAPALGENRP